MGNTVARVGPLRGRRIELQLRRACYSGVPRLLEILSGTPIRPTLSTTYGNQGVLAYCSNSGNLLGSKSNETCLDSQHSSRSYPWQSLRPVALTLIALFVNRYESGMFVEGDMIVVY